MKEAGLGVGVPVTYTYCFTDSVASNSGHRFTGWVPWPWSRRAEVNGLAGLQFPLTFCAHVVVVDFRIVRL